MVLLPSRLSRDVRPTRYELELNAFAPNSNDTQFEGVCTIHLEVHTSTSTIQLHAKDLHIQSWRWSGASMAQPTMSLQEDRMILQWASPIQRGDGCLEVKYTGPVLDTMVGLYRSPSTNLLSTQFEALDARRCFPCWDEPCFKATFDVTLYLPKEWTGLANMPVAVEEDMNSSNKRMVFKRTPPMSTYLLAVCMGPLASISNSTEHGVQISVYTAPGREREGGFALETAVATLDLLDDFFKGIPYPLPKLDLVAIPAFAAGAMENWGLVTFKEESLLLPEGEYIAPRRLIRVAKTVTHELVHQWFGNLVTMEWWDDLWLNEGFATFLSTYVTAKLHPDWGLWEDFVHDEVGTALRQDAFHSSHPIQVKVERDDEVEELFDAISYSKGAAVIGMVWSVLGETTFRNGLINYLHEHKYRNATTNDLWKAWGAVSAQPVQRWLSSWTKQIGYPYLTVQRHANGRWCLRQAQFQLDKVSPSSAVWYIPIQVPGKPLQFMTTPIMFVPENIDLNPGQAIPMRILQHMDGCADCPKKRFAQLSDSYAFCLAGHITTSELRRRLGLFQGEDNPTVWSALGSILHDLHLLLMDDLTSQASFDEIARTLTCDSFCAIGWKESASDTWQIRRLRGTLMSMMATFCSNDVQLRTTAQTMYDTNQVPSSCRVAVFRILLQDPRNNDRFRQLRKRTMDDEILSSLGFVHDAQCKQELLEWSMTPSFKSQDIPTLWASVSVSNKIGRVLCWDAFWSGISELKKRFQHTPSLMNSLLRIVCRPFSSDYHLCILKCDARHALDGTTHLRTLDQVTERMELNNRFVLTRMRGSYIPRHIFQNRGYKHSK